MTRLQALATDASETCRRYPGPGSTVLADLAAIEISIVSDRAIARVHRQFLRIPGATDVITFDHGEIIVSATTAAKVAQGQGEALDRELARYIIHGMLHLHGHVDENPAPAAEMWRAQESVLELLWPTRR